MKVVLARVNQIERFRARWIPAQIKYGRVLANTRDVRLLSLNDGQTGTWAHELGTLPFPTYNRQTELSPQI